MFYLLFWLLYHLAVAPASLVIVLFSGFADCIKTSLSVSVLSFDAPEQQRGQSTVLPVCQVPGHTGPEVSQVQEVRCGRGFSVWQRAGDPNCKRSCSPGVPLPRITSRTCLGIGAGQCSGSRRRQVPKNPYITEHLSRIFFQFRFLINVVKEGAEWRRHPGLSQTGRLEV